MNNALISPAELVYSPIGTLIGVRIADTAFTTFPVAELLYWIECADNVNNNEWYFQVETQSCQLKPIEQTISKDMTSEEKFALIIAERDKRLSATDWTQLADVIALHDQAWINSWNTYRQELRDLTNNVDLEKPIYPIPPIE
jgi:hypothetical protein